MFYKKELSKTLSLSCVESYFLAWIKEFTEVSKLYSHSFVPVKTVLEDFSNGAKYENYTAVPRVQELAEKHGIVAHRYLTDDEVNIFTAGAAQRIIRESGDRLCLVRVNDRFFEDSKRKAWRGDHYIAVDENMHWINDYPLSEGVFTDERFAEVFGGAMLIYRFTGADISLSDNNSGGIKTQSFEGINTVMSLSAFQGAVGVLRVTRKRLLKFYSKNAVAVSLLKPEISALDKLYLDAELKRIRGGGKDLKYMFDLAGILDYEGWLAEVI